MQRVSLDLPAAVLLGALLAVQARINAGLGEHLDDPLLAALFSFATGLVAVFALVAARPTARAAWSKVRQVPWWTCLGGLGGASLVAVGAFAAPRIGVAMLSLGLVAGQTTGGLLVDRAGFGPGSGQTLSGPRVGGAGLCLVAVLISASGKGATGDASPLLLALVVATGFLIALQLALNGRVRRQAGDAGVATLINFLVGTTALALGYLAVGAMFGWHIDRWPAGDQWWLYIGGPIGVTFVMGAAVIVRTLGVLRLGLAIIAGQLIGAIALDLAVPPADHGIATATLLGAGLTFVAVGISGWRTPTGRVEQV